MKVIHKIIVKDGRSIVMPAWKGGQEGYGNLALPDIRDVDTIQKYPIGTKLLDNERIFYYAKTTGTGITRTDLGVKNGFRQCIAQRSVSAAVVVGAKIVILTIGSDGIDDDGDIAKNELAGGYLVVFPETNANTYDSFVCRILENTETDDTGDEITLTLQDEVPVALDTSSLGECMHNPFVGCETNSDDQEPVVGVAHAQVTGAKWFWLQTWGPVWLSLQAEVGDAGHDHQVVFRHDGSFDEHDDDDTYTDKAQHAGFVLNHAPGGGQAAAVVMLQICP